MGERRFHQVSDPTALTARLLGEALSQVPALRPRLAIAGGSASAALRQRDLDTSLWRRLCLTWVDERLVPARDEASNRGGAYRAGLLCAADPPGLELPLVLDDERAELAMRRVTRVLDEDFCGGLDVLLLGMGEDGHIASLFPGRAWEGPGPVLLVEDSPKPPSRRLSLSLPFLATAGRALLLALGESKRTALLRLRDGDPSLPASHLPDLDVITDLEETL